MITPDPARKSYIAEDGVEIVYEEWGPPSPSAVLLCHGLASTGEQLRADAAYFASAGHRVLVPDLRGHGSSGRPRPTNPAGYSIATLGADMLGMLDAACVERVHWVGNSLGGIIALPLLASHPGRFLSFASFGTAYALSMAKWVPGSIPLVHTIFGARLRGALTARLTTRNRAARPLIARLVAGSDPHAAERIARHATRYDYTAQVQDTSVPILLLRGELDLPINSALAPLLQPLSQKPNFTIVDLPGGGHCSNLDATQAWRAALMAHWTTLPA